jgi:hypothetical protein
MRMRILRAAALASGALLFGARARAQWESVPEVPPSTIFSISATGDTIAAGADSVVFLSTDGGKHWQQSTRPVTARSAITAVRVRNHTLFAASFGQGVSTSDDLGKTWHAFNQGLVSGGLSAEFDIVDFVVRGPDLFGATAGSGVVARTLSPAGTWQSFGAIFEPNQDGNVNGLSLGGTRLLASAGSNGQVYVRDPGDADWTQSHLDNLGIHAGLSAFSSFFNGSGWVVGTNLGVFRSATGQSPWTRLDLRVGSIDWTAFAALDRHLFGAFDLPTGALILESGDDGASWGNGEFFPSAFVQAFATSGGFLYAARADGVFRRPLVASAGVSTIPGPSGLALAVAGAQPFQAGTRIRFELPAAGHATLTIYDLQGRSVATPLDESLPAGPHERAFDARALAPGVYTAVLDAAGRRESLRLVHLE